MGQICCPAVASFVVLLLLLCEVPPKELSAVIPKDECGTRPLEDEITGTRIVGRHNAQVAAWPWQVSLQIYRFGSGYQHVCGGSLINKNTVLTAAHCIKKWTHPKFWRAVIGTHHLYRHHPYTERILIRAIIVHDGFNNTTFEKDIALMKLVNFVQFHTFIQPICLPDGLLQVTSDTLCYISGWGSRKEKGRLTVVLQEAQVNIIPNKICNRLDWYRGTIRDDMICAGYEGGGTDSCQGDSGGPLMCYFPNHTRYYQLGIISFGKGCGNRKLPGVYIRTATYRSWIDSKSALYDKTTSVSISCVLIFWSVSWATWHPAL